MDILVVHSMKDMRVIAFDKTGTITQGRPGVTDIVPALGFNKDEVPRLRSCWASDVADARPARRVMLNVIKQGDET